MEKRRKGKQKRQTLRRHIAQEDLKVVLAGVCDVFTVRSKRAMEASANLQSAKSEGKMEKPAKVYKNYKELLADPEIDAVIIANAGSLACTDGHGCWPAQESMVNVEKGMTRTVDDAFALRKQ
jgi:predicted dehydrogenase